MLLNFYAQNAHCHLFWTRRRNFHKITRMSGLVALHPEMRRRLTDMSTNLLGTDHVD
ncbi:MAG: hypothetical protein ACM3VZ_05825 [Acidobacteriota bacterium]